MVADDERPGVLCRLGDRRGAVLVLGEHVDVLAEQALGRLGLRRGITPAGRVDHVGLGVRVDRRRAQLERVDVRDRLGDREGVDVAELVRLGRRSGEDAGQVDRLVHRAEVGAEVRRHLALDGAALVHDDDVGVLLGDGERGVEVAVAGGEDDLRALVDHALHDPGRLVGLGHVLGGEHLEVRVRLADGHGALVDRLVVAEVVLGADHDEADRLGFLSGYRRVTASVACSARAAVVAAARAEEQHQCSEACSDRPSCSHEWVLSGWVGWGPEGALSRSATSRRPCGGLRGCRRSADGRARRGRRSSPRTGSRGARTG